MYVNYLTIIKNDKEINIYQFNVITIKLFFLLLIDNLNI